MLLLSIDTQTLSIIISFGLVLISVVLTFVIAPGIKKTRTKKILSKTGVEADAIILHMKQTGLYVNKMPQVTMQVQVQPDRGRNFITEAHEVLSLAALNFIHAGSKIRVKYNPENIKEVMLIQ